MNELVIHEGELSEGIGETTEVAWISPKNLTYDEWCRIGRTLQQVHKSIQFWIGDWLCAGERRFGEIAMQAVEETGRSVESLLKCKAVSARFAPEDRRPGLSWSHHLAAAYTDPEFRDDLLGMAERYDLSTRDLKLAIAMPVRFLNVIIRAYHDNMGQAEFYRLFELTRLDAIAWNKAPVIDVTPKSLPEPEETFFDDGEPAAHQKAGDDLPFVDLGDADAYDWDDELDQNIDAVFSFFERCGAPLKAVYTSEVVWEGLAVRAGINRDGQPVLIWESVP